tara:strand:+ start:1408 stop:1581 length:174 start_codon:yes stop_codon:yes gene_type:complete
MFHPRILRHYNYRVIECNISAVDACADVAQYEGVNIHSLAQWLRTFDAIGAHRLHVL